MRRSGGTIPDVHPARSVMFGTLGGPELFLILLVALIVFGPRRLPEIGKSVGKMMAEFRRASNEFRQTLETEVEAEKIREAVRVDPTPPAPTTHALEPAHPDIPGTAHDDHGATPAVEPLPSTVS